LKYPKDVQFSPSFTKQFNKMSGKMQLRAQREIAAWRISPREVRFNDHLRKGAYQGYRSINITGDWRALYYEEGNTIIIFAPIGTHSQLYG
jgi:addiction module RelE/StbE family toxin